MGVHPWQPEAEENGQGLRRILWTRESRGLSLAIFLYLICFLGNFDSLVPKTIDSGTPGPVATALLVNVLLWVLWGIQHSLMARPGFKKWWTGIVPQHLERSTYVLISNLLMILIMWQWQPMTGVVWEVASPLGQNVLWALFFLGFGLVVLSSFIIDHFDLLGTRHVILYAMGRPYTPNVFKVVGFYKFVRHPLLLGWIIAFWATPKMTTGHLVFAIAHNGLHADRDPLRGEGSGDFPRRGLSQLPEESFHDRSLAVAPIGASGGAFQEVKNPWPEFLRNSNGLVASHSRKRPLGAGWMQRCAIRSTV